jgi:Lon protease-like protein
VNTTPRRYDDVPLFPLPKLVLFPGTRLPLHVFEPRYREMLADCLSAQVPLIAVAQLKPGWEAEYEGQPDIYDVSGLGRVIRHQHNPDGTYDIVLDAFSRVHLRELAPRGLRYRRAEATVLEDRVPKGGVQAVELTALLSLATRISGIVQRALPDFALQAAVDDAPALMTDRIADQLVLDPAARQDLLETLDVGSRVRTLTRHLSQLHMALSSATTGGTPTLH